MRKRPVIFALSASIGLCLLLVGCSSADEVSAAAAGQAEIAFQQGQYPLARQAIRKAIAARDDVSDYWLLLGRINVASSDLGGAFDAYENAIQLDRGNVEALRLLCQLGLTVRQPDKVDEYADQLLLLTPDDPVPIIMKGGAAFQRGDSRSAAKFADSVLAKNPRDDSALLLKARVLAAEGTVSSVMQAVKIIEESSSGGKDNVDRLTILKQLYSQLGDRAGYQRTIKLLAEAKPNEGSLQLEYADMLYQTGSGDAARVVIGRVMKQHPNEIEVASSILDLWLKEGARALNIERILTEASGLSLEMRAAYAQFANEMGRPDIAIAVIGGNLSKSPANTQNSNAKAALAFAIGLQGRKSDALRALNEILGLDPVQPRALLARARLLGAAGNFPKALADARMAVTQDPKNAVPRLALVDLLAKQGDRQLAETALREAVRAMPEEPRLAARLAALLVSRGQKQDAIRVFRDLVRAAPMDLRARQLQATLDPNAKDPALGAAAARPGAG